MKKIKTILVLLLAIPLLSVAQKKNVLFIAVDDLKTTLGAYGDKFAITPNIDKIANNGVVFQNNHCQQAVCGPSRASLLTGVRPDSTRVWDLKTLIRDMNPNIVTLPQHFKSNGYTVYGTGKIFDKRSVDKQNDGVSWSKPQLFEGDEKHWHKDYEQPLLHYYQLPETRKLAEKYIAEAKAKGKKGYGITKYALNRIKPSTEKVDIPDNAYVDGVISLTAIDMLEDASKKKNPFFLAVGFKRPHLPFNAPTKYWDLYKRDEVKLAEYQKKAKNSPNFAYHNYGELRSYSDIPNKGPLFEIIPEAKQRELIHGYYAAVSYIDAQIGKIIDKLDELGLKDNTVIVLWGDHGWHLGDHGMWCKHSNFEQATRAPLIIAGSSVKASQNTSPTEFVDIFPTLCEMTKVPAPKKLAGKSLVPILKGKTKSVKKYAVSQFPRGKKRMGYGFRTDRYRYVVWLDVEYSRTKQFDPSMIQKVELYDYEKDPLETKNLANNPKYKATVKELEELSTEFFMNQGR